MNPREVRDIALSMLVIAIAFAWPGFPLPPLYWIAISFAAVIIAVGTGFVLHELAHKYTAIHYGSHAEYFAWPYGLGLALLLSLVTNGGFVFAAPGAVYIFGDNLGRKENGIISAAGPLTNIIIAAIFLLVSILVLPFSPLVAAIAGIGMRVNLFLAAFNLLPFGPLDGTKVISWNPLVWGVLFVPSAVIAFLPGLVS
ncbi:MAG: site-2 protease family protein [Candidatus Diapherotrites archaeon]|uniref:Site-2 protease family protein n=1 Tax=Candidatus Iainarchaeum sp. TaxID=3101447 RepID=A0A8T4KRB1_9ARCH|nr:site-2 protease family protein [Candidatus Diapherotrites archaeon]